MQPFRVGIEGKHLPSVSTLGRCASVSGKLEVRLMGCQDLLEEVPGRSRRDKDNSSSPGDLRSFVKGNSMMTFFSNEIQVNYKFKFIKYEKKTRCNKS